MLFRIYQPAVPLQGFIEDFWSYDDYVPPHSGERILPSGTFELVFNLKDDELRIYNAANPAKFRRLSGAVISGPYSGYFGSDAAEEVRIMGVHFRPGGASPFLGFPAGDLADSHIDLAELWQGRASDLRERLAATREVDERFRILERALVEHLYRPLEHHPAVATALQAFHTPNPHLRTGALARRVGLSERRFIDVFRAEVGMTPKRFARIHRFQQLLSFVGRIPSPDWSELADRCGYFDQSHLIRDFLAFSGLTPTDFVRRQDTLRKLGAHMKRHHLAVADGASVFSKTRAAKDR
jgi:AraC-like DNA-binding protein